MDAVQIFNHLEALDEESLHLDPQNEHDRARLEEIHDEKARLEDLLDDVLFFEEL